MRGEDFGRAPSTLFHAFSWRTQNDINRLPEISQKSRQNAKKVSNLLTSTSLETVRTLLYNHSPELIVPRIAAQEEEKEGQETKDERRRELGGLGEGGKTRREKQRKKEAIRESCAYFLCNVKQCNHLNRLT